MKFICLGYADLEKMKQYSPEQLTSLMDECFAYDDELRRGGNADPCGVVRASIQ